jgi:hypothetical protein
MSRGKHYTKDQIIKVLREMESGATVSLYEFMSTKGNT